MLPWSICMSVASNSSLNHLIFLDLAPSDFQLSRYLKKITLWAWFWGRWSRHYGHKQVDCRTRSKFLLWKCKSIAAKTGKVCWSPKDLCLKLIKQFWWKLISCVFSHYLLMRLFTTALINTLYDVSPPSSWDRAMSLTKTPWMASMNSSSVWHDCCGVLVVHHWTVV